MWCLTAPGVVVHRIRDDKSAATFTDLLGDYTGTVVCDALGTHGAGARASPGLTLAGCWAHYPESLVIPSWLPAFDEPARQALKIIQATVRGTSTSI